MMVHSGLSPPNKRDDDAVEPVRPVKPVRLPSVTIRCEMLPEHEHGARRGRTSPR